MANIPKHTVTIIRRHSWEITHDGGGAIIARDLRDGIFFAEKEMQEKYDVDTSYDDAYSVTVGDESVILRVDEESGDVLPVEVNRLLGVVEGAAVEYTKRSEAGRDYIEASDALKDARKAIKRYIGIE
jgi:hypothetical protein